MATQPAVTFGDLLRRYRLTAGLTQEELADRAQVSPRAISDLERGARNRPYRETIKLLADALQLDVTERDQLKAAARPTPPPRPDPLQCEDRSANVGQPRPLPTPLSPPIGRDAEKAVVSQLLRRADVRLVTLTGPGGIGKTSLALEIAAELRSDYGGNVVFAPLAAITDPRQVGPAVARSLGVAEVAHQSPWETVRGSVRDGRLLLVLDNFEQVLDAALDVAALAACPGLKVLVTSRAPLHVRGEHQFLVPPLCVPPALPGQTRDEVSKSSAVQLFVVRAQEVKADFALTDRTAPIVGEICRRLDGLPLAIELAAAKVRLLPLPAILTRLANRLTLLDAERRDVPARQQTLRATIDWSHDLLDPPDQWLFRRLSMFVDGFSLEAAEWVSGVGAQDVIRRLDRLADQGLIQAQGVDDEPRFSMLETIREYAREKLVACGEEATAGRAYASFFLTQVTGTGQIAVEPKALVPIAWLERERHNLRAALRWFRDEGIAADGLRLAVSLGGLWYSFGPRSEHGDWLTTFLQLTTLEPHSLTRAAALKATGRSAMWRGDSGAARVDYEEGLAIARELADRAAEAEFLKALGVLELDQGNLAAAHQLDEAAALLREIGPPLVLWDTLVWCGVRAYLAGDIIRAQSLYEESVTLGGMASWSQRLLGYVALRAGDFVKARTVVRDSLLSCVQERVLVGQVECLNVYAGIAIARQQWLIAARILGGVAAFYQTVLRGRMSIPDRNEHERFVAETQAALGAEALAAAWAEGEAMTLDEAVADVLIEEAATLSPPSRENV